MKVLAGKSQIPTLPVLESLLKSRGLHSELRLNHLYGLFLVDLSFLYLLDLGILLFLGLNDLSSFCFLLLCKLSRIAGTGLVLLFLLPLFSLQLLYLLLCEVGLNELVVGLILWVCCWFRRDEVCSRVSVIGLHSIVLLNLLFLEIEVVKQEVFFAHHLLRLALTLSSSCESHAIVGSTIVKLELTSYIAASPKAASWMWFIIRLLFLTTWLILTLRLLLPTIDSILIVNLILTYLS